MSSGGFVGGKLKLKGDAAGVSKKKKKKKSTEGSELALAAAADGSGSGAAAAKAPSEPVKTRDGFVLPAPPEGADRRTEAQKRHEARLEKLEAERLAKQAAKGYRDRVKEFNEHLASLSEHHDIPKVGPG